jgi:hypothetical protein
MPVERFCYYREQLSMLQPRKCNDTKNANAICKYNTCSELPLSCSFCKNLYLPLNHILIRTILDIYTVHSQHVL